MQLRNAPRCFGRLLLSPAGGAIACQNAKVIGRSFQIRWLVILGVLGLLATARPMFAALPTGWTNEDIGSPPAAGSAFYGAGNWTNFGSGSGINGTSDQFNFTHTSLNGDGDIVALIKSQTGLNAAALAGVMMRTDNTPGSPEAAIFLTQSNGVSFRYRTITGGATTQANVAGVNARQQDRHRG